MLSWCGEYSNMAEFYLYEIYCIAKGIQDQGNVPGNTLTIWEHCFKDPRMLKGLEFYIKSEEHNAALMGYKYFVAGLHTHTRKYLDPKDIKELFKYFDMEDCWPERGCPFIKAV
jgi:hypothetical protein